MPRAGVDAGRATAVARQIVDEQGADALTLAGVAARLGIAPPSLYKHVRGIDDLRARVALSATQALVEVLATAALGRSASEALSTMAHAYRAFATAHPGLYALTQVAPDPAHPQQVAEASRAVEVMRTTLLGYGIPDAQIVDAVRLVRSALHGFVDLERVGGFGIPRSVDSTFDLVVAALDAGLMALADGRLATGR